MNAQAMASAVQSLKAQRNASGRVLEREHPQLARAIDEVLRTWRAAQR
jgi:hypothetical protein